MPPRIRIALRSCIYSYSSALSDWCTIAVKLCQPWKGALAPWAPIWICHWNWWDILCPNWGFGTPASVSAGIVGQPERWDWWWRWWNRLKAACIQSSKAKHLKTNKKWEVGWVSESTDWICSVLGCLFSLLPFLMIYEHSIWLLHCATDTLHSWFGYNCSCQIFHIYFFVLFSLSLSLSFSLSLSLSFSLSLSLMSYPSPVFLPLPVSHSLCPLVCAENHVRTWTVTRFRGRISTQPGSTPIASFRVLSLEGAHSLFYPINSIGEGRKKCSVILWC